MYLVLVLFYGIICSWLSVLMIRFSLLEENTPITYSICSKCGDKISWMQDVYLVNFISRKFKTVNCEHSIVFNNLLNLPEIIIPLSFLIIFLSTNNLPSFFIYSSFFLLMCVSAITDYIERKVLVIYPLLGILITIIIEFQFKHNFFNMLTGLLYGIIMCSFFRLFSVFWCKYRHIVFAPIFNLLKLGKPKDLTHFKDEDYGFGNADILAFLYVGTVLGAIALNIILITSAVIICGFTFLTRLSGTDTLPLIPSITFSVIIYPFIQYIIDFY